MTHRRRRRILPTLVLLALGLGYCSTASATSTGYVCQSGWTPNPGALASYLTNMGAYGTVYTYVYSQPSCKGAQVGFAYFCTIGATNTTYCALNQLMTETQAASLASSLHSGGALGQKVTVYTSSGSAGTYVEFTQP